jgi:hypothetical protein
MSAEPIIKSSKPVVGFAIRESGDNFIIGETYKIFEDNGFVFCDYPLNLIELIRRRRLSSPTVIEIEADTASPYEKDTFLAKTVKVIREMTVDDLNDISGVFRTQDGNTTYLQNGKYHRDDGPARIFSSGEEHWYYEGELHRLDGPAITRSDGSYEWHQFGWKHRDNGPAVQRPDGTKEWFYQSEPHRIGGPAREYPDGRKEWARHGLWYSTHRIKNDDHDEMENQVNCSLLPKRDSDSKLKCVVCWKRYRNTVLTDCHHMTTCGSCTDRLKEQNKPCPFCHAPIKDTFLVHRSHTFINTWEL